MRDLNDTMLTARENSTDRSANPRGLAKVKGDEGLFWTMVVLRKSKATPVISVASGCPQNK